MKLKNRTSKIWKKSKMIDSERIENEIKKNEIEKKKN